MDIEKVKFVPDFIELALEYFQKNGVDTGFLVDNFSSERARVIIGSESFAFERAPGKGVKYMLNTVDEEGDSELPSVAMEDIIS